MPDIMARKSLIQRFVTDALEISFNDYCLIGGMFLEGIDLQMDIDFMVSSRSLEKVRTNKLLSNNPKKLEVEAYFCQFEKQDIDIKVEFYDHYLGISDDEIINNQNYHYFIGGVKIIRPELVCAQKLMALGEWHKDSLALTGYALANPEKWCWKLVIDGKKHTTATQSQALETTKNVNKSLFSHKLVTSFFCMFVPLKKWRHKIRQRMLATNNSLPAQTPLTPPVHDILTLVRCSTHEIDMSYFLAAQRDQNGDFDIYDVFLRCLALDEVAGKNNFGMALWERCHQQRFLANNDHPTERERDTRTRLLSLATLMKYETNLRDHPITTADNGVVGDGGHRIAVAINFAYKTMSFKTSLNFSGRRNYGRVWLSANGFTEDEIRSIETKQHEIMSSYHVYFPIIIWPPAFELTMEIEADLKSMSGFDYIRSQTLLFNSDTEFAAFVRAVYESDDIAKWKIERKIAFMKTGSLPYHVHCVWLDNRFPNFRRKKNDALLSATNEQLKRTIRSKYSTMIPNYVNDIIMHIGDNYRHNAAIDEVIEHYEIIY